MLRVGWNRWLTMVTGELDIDIPGVVGNLAYAAVPLLAAPLRRPFSTGFRGHPCPGHGSIVNLALAGDSHSGIGRMMSLTRAFWSGRRDSNPRPSPWQVVVSFTSLSVP